MSIYIVMFILLFDNAYWILFLLFDRVAVQNQRYDDWSPTLTYLRQLFNEYLPTVLDHHRNQGIYVPEATNSCASQGNFLEVLNISLNGNIVFFFFLLTLSRLYDVPVRRMGLF